MSNQICSNIPKPKRKKKKKKSNNNTAKTKEQDLCRAQTLPDNTEIINEGGIIKEHRRCLSSILSAFLIWTQSFCHSNYLFSPLCSRCSPGRLGYVVMDLSPLQCRASGTSQSQSLAVLFFVVVATCHIHITCLFGTLSHLTQVKYLKFLALAETSLCGKFLGLWSWLIHGDNITFKQEAAALQGIFLLPLNLTTGDINHTTVSAFWWGLTSCLVLFWYLSLRNSCRYSDPSVWRGSFVDEVRLLTAMKQYLKDIKRHFPWLDSRRFKLTQVLHLTTESCANALLHVLRGAQRVHLFVCYQTDRTLKVSIRSGFFFWFFLLF